jgi:hypothetical protein
MTTKSYILIGNSIFNRSLPSLRLRMHIELFHNPDELSVYTVTGTNENHQEFMYIYKRSLNLNEIRTHINPYLEDKVVKLLHSGYNLKQIANEVGVGQDIVVDILRC